MIDFLIFIEISMVTILGIPGVLFILCEILRKRFSIGPTSE